MKSILTEIVEKVLGDDFFKQILTEEVRKRTDKLSDMADEFRDMLNKEQQEAFINFLDEENSCDLLLEDECTRRAFRKGILFGMELCEYYRN